MRSEPPSPDADDFHLHAWVDESVRHEALFDRVEVKGLHRWAVAAA